MIQIDKSRFTAEELEQYEALIAKGAVDPAAAKEEMEEEDPPVVTPKKKKPAQKAEDEEMEKSDKLAPEVQAAMDELAALKKSFEMKEMTEVAKKYAPLGKKEAELAQTLYEMKKSNPANYDAYIAILDESLSIVEKSGMFAEIGKSAGGNGNSGSTEQKVQARAQEIMKSEGVDYVTAVAKAWEDPELAAAYDKEYYG